MTKERSMTTESVEETMKVILSELVLNSRVEDKADADALVEEITARIYHEGYAIEQGWRDIGSAPKDGTRILVPYPVFHHGNTTNTPDEYVVIGVCWKAVGWCSDGGWMLHEDPAVWRPLPAAPGGSDANT